MWSRFVCIIFHPLGHRHTYIRTVPSFRNEEANATDLQTEGCSQIGFTLYRRCRKSYRQRQRTLWISISHSTHTREHRKHLGMHTHPTILGREELVRSYSHCVSESACSTLLHVILMVIVVVVEAVCCLHMVPVSTLTF